MPSAATDFRQVCGSFVPVFVAFMAKRAKKKLAMRIAIVTLSRRLDGVTFGLTLTYLFWGGFLMRCGDIESNPGPTAPPVHPAPPKDTTRHTRQTTLGSSRSRLSVDKSGDSSPLHSPRPQEPTLSDVMATLSTLKAMGDQMKTTLEEVKQDVRDLREGYVALQGDVKALKDEVTDLRQENQELHRTNDTLMKKMQDCDARIDDLEGRSKRNNLLFYGLPRRENETSADCEGVLRDLILDKLDLSVDIEFDRVHRLSARQDSPIIARCVFYKHKVNILKAKRNLKGSNVFIGEDFSKGVREVRRRLTPHLKKARQDGSRATMIYNYLLVDGKKYTVDSEERLVEVK
eukprot:TRINITY_DN15544_c0_g1_i7.p1 TRINITY_DN15544_c0_g1~~TRINITY_DN15544_c0_g1_i7.p1  ORF type:complete len:407 (+),score=79.65 TRINITY_DN15544_c0_g1_i7:186-1223(+)